MEESNDFSGILRANGQFCEHRESISRDEVQVRSALPKLDRETGYGQGAEEGQPRIPWKILERTPEANDHCGNNLPMGPGLHKEAPAEPSAQGDASCL